MFRQADLSQFFWGTLGLLKGKMKKGNKLIFIFCCSLQYEQTMNHAGFSIN
jgi:hypothetical protein